MHLAREKSNFNQKRYQVIDLIQHSGSVGTVSYKTSAGYREAGAGLVE